MSNTSADMTVTARWLDALEGTFFSGLEQLVDYGIEKDLLTAASVVPEYKNLALIGDAVAHFFVAGVSASESENQAITLSAASGSFAAGTAATGIVSALAAEGAIAATPVAFVVSALVPVVVGAVVGYVLEKALESLAENIPGVAQDVITAATTVENSISGWANATLSSVQNETSSLISNISQISSKSADFESKASNAIINTISNIGAGFGAATNTLLNSLGLSSVNPISVDTTSVNGWISGAFSSLLGQAPTTSEQAIGDLNSYIATSGGAAPSAPIDLASVVESEAATSATPLPNGLTITPINNNEFMLSDANGGSGSPIIYSTFTSLGETIKQVADELTDSSEIITFPGDGSSLSTY